MARTRTPVPVSRLQFDFPTLYPIGDCYRNTYIACRKLSKIFEERCSKKEVRYAEGLAVHPKGIVPHAWCVIDGEVWDFTWADITFRTTYFGIDFDLEVSWDIQRSIGRHGILANWKKTRE